MNKNQFGKNNSMYKHGIDGSRFSRIFRGMKSRCTCKNDHKYSLYGARGIRVEWLDLVEFKDDMFRSYNNHCLKFGIKNTQIDRIDSNGNYSKSNCRWVTIKEQNHNRRNIKMYRYRGKMMTIAEISKLKGLSKNTLYERINRGIKINLAISLWKK